LSKKRPVSDEDAALFRDAVGKVRIIDDDREPVYRRRGKFHAKSRARDSAPDDQPAQTQPDAAPERDSAQLFVRPGLQNKHIRRLRRGQIPIEAEADLHGLRAHEAETHLKFFLSECRDEGLRCVRVIHGKGRGSQGGRAVLKWEVDRWLRRHDGVVAFCTAQPRHGGSGAVYVLLER
jgi:DNA-nicking Smr family endonuclease